LALRFRLRGATGTGSPAPAAGQGCRTGRTATGCGHGQPATLPATGNARHGRTDRHGKAPASVETWRNAGRVAAVCEQKSRQPVKGSRQGKTAGV